MRFLLVSAAVMLPAGPIAAAERPSILFCSPQGAGAGWVDLGYLAELHAKGFEVDYTDHLGEVTAERIRRYNVLVLYVTPDAFDVTMRGQRSSPEKIGPFVALIEGYVQSGGGVLLMPWEANILKQAVADLTDRWGARVPVEHIIENDPEKIAPMTHSAQGTPLAFTDQVLPSPVSEGVRQLWYPYAKAYNGGMANPLLVDNHWQVVVKASKTSVTRPVDLSKAATPLPNPFMRPGGVPEPPLFAVRTLGQGRVAFVCQWPQFTVGSGTKWIFNREVLDRGLKGKPSDFGRLLENTFRWLAAPSQQSGAPGGYVTPADRLQPPNARPEVKKQYEERLWPYDRQALGAHQVPRHLKLYRGLIGVKSALSSGTGSIEAYARTARACQLHFLVFMEDFDQLTPAKFDQLKADCRKHSGPDLLLLPGFTITSNIGNHLFFFGPDPAWPPDLVLSGPDKKLFYMQEEDGKGHYTGYVTPFLDWILHAYHVEKGQVGYYNFKGSPHGLRLHDCRLYAAVGLRYYRKGELVEDLTEDYLTTAECTIPPAPLSINEVASPTELRREVEAGHTLTWGQAVSLDPTAPGGLFMNALRWTHQYDAPNVYCSDGPQILAWPGCHRVWTYGGEEFVTGSAVMPSPLVVTAAKGLKQIRIYNGRRLFRRFLLEGRKDFNQTLVLDGSIQKNLVLVAEDTAGGKAVSFARRCWKDGALAPTFCSDHVNDGGHMYLAHGPNHLPLTYHPALPYNLAGDTWDGGPTACLPLVTHQDTIPLVDTDKGKEDVHRLDQIPLLDFSDEGVTVVASLRREVFDDRLRQVVNAWHTYGPIAGPSRLVEHLQRYREYVTPTIDAPHTGWAAPGIRVGINPSLLTNELRFKEDVTVRAIQLALLTRNARATLVVGRGESMETVDLAKGYPTFLLTPGDWFAVDIRGPSNRHLFINRAGPIRLKIAGHLELWADLKDRPFRKDATYRFEMAAFGFPVNVDLASPAEFQRYIAYLRAPYGLEIRRGQRVTSPGLVEVSAQDHAVELLVKKPLKRLDLTLPVRIAGLNPRWSAGLWQKQGYSKGFYGPGMNRYRALGVDEEGYAYVPLYVDYADQTHVVAGHPVVADEAGQRLFIQVTQVARHPDRWHVSVNNPSNKPVTTLLKAAMDLPGLAVPDRPQTLRPGEYRVLQ